MVIVSPTDNAYMNTQNPLQLLDPGLNRSIQITSRIQTPPDRNPWADGARVLSDLGDDEWQHMVCLEGSNILKNGRTGAVRGSQNHSYDDRHLPLTSAA